MTSGMHDVILTVGIWALVALALALWEREQSGQRATYVRVPQGWLLPRSACTGPGWPLR